MSSEYLARVRNALEGYQKKMHAELYPEPKTPRGKAKPGVPLEKDEQAALARYLKSVGVLYCASANGVYMSMKTAARMRSQGMKPGFPDIMIYDPMVYEGKGYVGVAIELKRIKGGKVSDTQETWLQRLRERGWLAFVSPGANYAIERLERCRWMAKG